MHNTFGDLLKDPVVWAGIERILIELGAVFCIWAGYKFYRMGINERASKGAFGSYKSSFWTSGIGSGLCCIILGALVLLAGLITDDRVRHTPSEGLTTTDIEKKHIDALESSIATLDAKIEDLHNKIEKQTPDNSSQYRLELLQLKNDLKNLAARVEKQESEKASKKSESRHSRKKWTEGRGDNESNY